MRRRFSRKEKKRLRNFDDLRIDLVKTKRVAGLTECRKRAGTQPDDAYALRGREAFAQKDGDARIGPVIRNRLHPALGPQIFGAVLDGAVVQRPDLLRTSVRGLDHTQRTIKAAAQGKRVLP